MEILSPQSLWSDYDRTALPLDVSVLTSETRQDGTLSERLYFSGERTASGVTRIFAHLWLPKERKPPVIIAMCDLGDDIDKFDAEQYLESGYAVLAVDYAGQRDGKERFTIYPKELDGAAYFKHPDALSLIPSNPEQSCRYIWTTVLLRAITKVQSDERLSDSIALIGIGAGGSQVIKASAIEDLKCGITIFTTDPALKAGDDEISFKACMDNGSYVSLSRFPMLSVLCSNDSDGFFDRMSAVYAGTGDKYYLSVGERVGRAVLAKQQTCIRAWLNRYLKMGLPLEIAAPEITARESERSLYYVVKADMRLAVEKVELFVAHSIEIGEFRNWRNVKLLSAGEGEYIAKVPVYDTMRPVYAFASVVYEDGFTFSTPLLVKTPALMGVHADNFVKSRLLYDSDSGTDDFVSPGGGDDIVMRSGAYDILGVCAEGGELATYKPGDIQFRADESSVLQLIVYSEKEQEAEFAVRTRERGGEAEYVCRKKMERSGNWTKFTLSAEEFKSGEGALHSFASAVYFCVRGKGILVNTMLWV